MKRLCGDDAANIGLKYEGGMIKCRKDLLLLMLGGGYLQDNGRSNKTIFIDNQQICSNPKTLQLGWNSVVTAELSEGTFTIKNVVLLNEGVGLFVYDNHGYSQIVTHSVGSCTFVCVKQNNKYIIAHLDAKEDYLNQALQIIIAKLEGEKGDVCFCSCVDGDAENCFKDSLVQHVIKMRHFSRLTAPGCLNHMEIGISAEEDGMVKLFGDIVKLGDFATAKGDIFIAPCLLVEEILTTQS